MEISTGDLTTNPFPVDVLIQLSSSNLVTGFPFIGYSRVSLVRNLVKFRLVGVGVEGWGYWVQFDIRGLDYQQCVTILDKKTRKFTKY